MIERSTMRLGLLSAMLLSGCEAAPRSSPPQAPADASTAATAAIAEAPASTSRAPAPALSAAPAPRAPATLALPGAAPGIGFDDLRFCHVPDVVDAVVAPAGRSGKVDLIDPVSNAVAPIGGFSESPSFGGGHDFGVTSADAGFDGLLAVDRTAKTLSILDPVARKITSTTPLAASPDYVRYFVPFREAWVTEPDADQIEVFELAKLPAPQAAYAGGNTYKQSAIIPTKGGPESLVFDIQRGRAYAHLWAGQTISIDTTARKIVATWPNGCAKSRGIDLDMGHGILFVGCGEGKAVTLDVQTGKQLASAQVSGDRVDIIAFAEGLRHLYVPSASSGTMTILGVSEKGALSVLGQVPAATGAHCVAADGNGFAYVCDPSHGAILKIPDPYPPAR
ncbi:MAG: hypothetical protein U0359_12735 [Byssovorax sp.]